MSPAAYTFSSDLNFSSNHTLGCLVADIPMLAVGLLAFAVSSFFLIVRKLDRAILFISSSALLDFFAAILDLSQVLIRGSVEGSSDSTLNSLLSARDVFYSLASGARFLSFWTIIAQCPRGEMWTPDDSSTNGSQPFLSFESTVHTGSWMRWGVIGILLKWGTAAMAISIALLQILWRTIDSFDNPGVVYAVENGLEIVVSVIFIVKMLLNSAIAETATSWQLLLQYSPIIVALGLNIGISIGNLSLFAFSESAIGRLLLAAELYIVIETLLVWKFYPTTGDMPERSAVEQSAHNEKRRASSFQGLRMSRSDPLRSLSNTSSVIGDSHVLSRFSASGRRMPSWMIRTTSGLSGWHRPALERDEARLFDPQDAERGRSPSPWETDQGAAATNDYSPTEPKQSARYADPVFTSFFMDSQRGENSFTPERSLPSKDDSTRRESREASVVPSYYVGVLDSQSVLVPPPAVLQPDSPIFGLNGTIRGGRFSPIVPSTAVSSPALKGLAPIGSPVSLESPRKIGTGAGSAASTRSSSYEQLMREQSELEKSIAQLRMFASSSSIGLYGQTPMRDSSTDSAPRETVASSYSNGAPLSASVKSEFSLSNFPEPPLVRRSSQVRPNSVLREQRVSAASEGTATRRDSDEDQGLPSFLLAPPRMPIALHEQTVPSSTRASEDSAFIQANLRTESAGTQYDVTSFIGSLSRTPSALATSSIKPDDDVSEPMSATSAEIVTVERRPSDGKAVRAYRLDGDHLRKGSTDTAISTKAPTSRTIISSRDQSADGAIDTVDPTPYPVSSTLSQENSPKALSPTLSSPKVEFGRTPSGREVGLPARPRMIGHPKKQSSMDSSPLAYEQPRPAPGPAF